MNIVQRLPRLQGQLACGSAERPASAGAGSRGTVGGATQDARMAELSVRHREMLAFEAQWWRHEVNRPTAVRQLFGLTEQRYQQIMNVIIEWPQALAHDPLLVRRLRRDRAVVRADRNRPGPDRLLSS
jgi:hypothetical protein